MLIELLIGGAVAAGTYVFAKKKKNASTGQSATAAAITGAAGAGAAYLAILAWPLLLVGGAVAGGYLFAKRRDQKALPPASES